MDEGSPVSLPSVPRPRSARRSAHPLTPAFSLLCALILASSGLAPLPRGLAQDPGGVPPAPQDPATPEPIPEDTAPRDPQAPPPADPADDESELDQTLREAGIFGTDEEFEVYYDFQQIQAAEDGSALAWLFLGNVLIEGADFALRADAIGVFIEGFDEEGRPLRPRVFAEGSILLTRGNQSFRAETFFWEVDARRAVMTKARLRIDQEFLERLRQKPVDDPSRARAIIAAFAPGPEVELERGSASPLVIAAEVLTVQDFERVHGEGIEVTTCEFGHPHWALRADEGTAEERQETRPFPGEKKPGGWNFELEDVGLDTGPITIPLLPGVVFDSRWGRYLPLRSVSYSHSGKYGDRVDTLWNGNVLLPSALSKEVDLALRLDYLSERGTGYGADIEWGRDPLRWAPEPDGRADIFGIGEYWAIEDRGTDSNGTVPPDEDRHRTHLHQRIRLQTRTLVDFEYYDESDANFLNEYFEDEERAEKEPENLIYLRQPLTGETILTILASDQAADERETLEKHPETKLYYIEEPDPWVGIVLDGEAAIADLEDKPTDTSGLPDRENQRADVRLLGAKPLRIVRGVRLRPFFEGRYTYWQEDLAGDEEDRLAFAAGGTLSQRVWRTWPTDIPALGIRGLRHIVDFDITYENLFHTDVEPAELIVLDEVEELTEREAVRLGLFQRFFTRRTVGAGGRAGKEGYDVRSLLDSRFEIEWFPDRERDNAGESWGPLAGEVLLTPLEPLGAFVDGEYDIDDGYLDEINFGFRWLENRALLLEVSSRQQRHLQDTLILGGRWWGSDRFEFGAWTELDLRRDEAVNQRYSVVRNFHSWSVAFSYEIDEGEDDNRTFRVDFGPRDLLGWGGSKAE